LNLSNIAKTPWKNSWFEIKIEIPSICKCCVIVHTKNRLSLEGFWLRAVALVGVSFSQLSHGLQVIYKLAFGHVRVAFEGAEQTAFASASPVFPTLLLEKYSGWGD
jgi:hypothetical protein